MRLPKSLPKLPASISLTTRTVENYVGDRSQEVLWTAPRSEDELRKVVRWGIQQNLQIRFGGGGHAPNRQFVPDANESGPGLVVSMNNLKGFSLDANQETAWAEAGVTIVELAAKLRKAGFTTGGLPTGKDITVGGATASGVHGSSVDPSRSALFSDAVSGIDIMGPDGEVHRFTSEEDLKLLRVNLGMYGAVVRVKFDLSKAYHVKHEQEKVPYPEVVQRLDELVEQPGDARHVRFVLNPPRSEDGFDGTGVLWIDCEVPAPASEAAAQQNAEDTAAARRLQELKFIALSKAISVTPYLGPLAVPALKKITELGFGQPMNKPIYGADSEIHVYEYGVNLPDLSMSVPFEKTDEALKAVEDVVRETGVVFSAPIAARIVEGSEKAVLNHNRGSGLRTTLQFPVLEAFEKHRDSDQDAFAWGKAHELIGERLKALGGTVHQGKRTDVVQGPLPVTAQELEQVEALRARIGTGPEDNFMSAEVQEVLDLTREQVGS